MAGRKIGCLPEELSIVSPVLFVFGSQDYRLEEPPVQSPPGRVDLCLIDCVSHGPLALLLPVPAWRALGQRDVISLRQGHHSCPGYVVTTAELLKGDAVAPDLTAETVERVRVPVHQEGGCLLLVVRQDAQMPPSVYPLATPATTLSRSVVVGHLKTANVLLEGNNRPPDAWVFAAVIS